MIISDAHGFTAEIPDPPQRDWSGLDRRGHIPAREPLWGWRLWWLTVTHTKVEDNPDAIVLEVCNADGEAYARDGKIEVLSEPAQCLPSIYDRAGNYGRQRVAHARRVGHGDSPSPHCVCGYCMTQHVDDVVRSLGSPLDWHIEARAQQGLPIGAQIPMMTYCARLGPRRRQNDLRPARHREGAIPATALRDPVDHSPRSVARDPSRPSAVANSRRRQFSHSVRRQLGSPTKSKKEVINNDRNS